MLVVIAVPGFYESETGQRALAHIAEELGERGNVVRINAEGVRRIAHHTGCLRSAGTGGASWVSVQELMRVSEVDEDGCRIAGSQRGRAFIIVEARAVGDRVVQPPRHLRLVKFLKNGANIELAKVVIIAWVPDQPLGGTAGESCNAVGNALARN